MILGANEKTDQPIIRCLKFFLMGCIFEKMSFEENKITDISEKRVYPYP